MTIPINPTHSPDLSQTAAELRAENVYLRRQVTDAAHEINCQGTIAERIMVLKLEHSAAILRQDARINAAEARAVAAEAQVVALQEALVATTDLVMNSACVDGLDFDEPWIMTAIAAREAVAARSGQGAGGALDGGAT